MHSGVKHQQKSLTNNASLTDPF